MKTSTLTKRSISIQSIASLIEEAQNAELCRDLELSESIFAPLWPDILTEPDIVELDQQTQASLFRLFGFFLSFYGHVKGRSDFQLRGKDMLTKAIELFEETGMPERVAEAQVMLALAYWYSGEVEESETILQAVEQTFKGNELHPVYLQIKVNKLMIMFWKGEYPAGVEIIEQIATPMEVCEDDRLKTMFHNQAGILFNVLNRYENAVFHLDKAITYASRSGNKRFMVLNLNNVAYSNKQLGRYEMAHQLLDHAESINRSLNDSGGPMAHLLDSRALVFIDQREPQKGLDKASEAVRIFAETEDYANMAESLWTKCRCLLRLDRMSEALIEFGRLQSIASERIGSSAMQKYADLFAGEIYPMGDRPLAETVGGFKKTLIMRAMKKANNGIIEASKLLGLNSHQALSEMLNKQFPEIYGELGVKRRARRQDAKVLKSPVRGKMVVREISRIRSFKAADLGDCETFYFSANVMKCFGIAEESVVSVCKTDGPEVGQIMLFLHDDELVAARVDRDQFSGLLFAGIDGREVLLEDLTLIGKPAKYCPLSQTDAEKPDFRPLSEADPDKADHADRLPVS